MYRVYALACRPVVCSGMRQPDDANCGPYWAAAVASLKPSFALPTNVAVGSPRGAFRYTGGPPGRAMVGWLAGEPPVTTGAAVALMATCLYHQPFESVWTYTHNMLLPGGAAMVADQPEAPQKPLLSAA